MRKTLGTLVLAIIACISSSCAKPQIQNEIAECRPTREMVKEAAKYIILLEEQPQLAAKGLPLPYSMVVKQHVRCLDQTLRSFGDGRYGVLTYDEGYMVIEYIY